MFIQIVILCFKEKMGAGAGREPAGSSGSSVETQSPAGPRGPPGSWILVTAGFTTEEEQQEAETENGCGFETLLDENPSLLQFRFRIQH